VSDDVYFKKVPVGEHVIAAGIWGTLTAAWWKRPCPLSTIHKNYFNIMQFQLYEILKSSGLSL